MTDVATDYLEELAGRRAARAPASFGEVWNAEWSRAGLDTLGGVGRPLGEAQGELEAAIEREAGTDLASYAAEKNVALGSAVTTDQRIKLLGDLADTLPEEKRKPLEPLRDVRKRASDKAHAIEREASDVADGTYGLSGTAVAFTAGIARQAVDPANLVANIAVPGVGPLTGRVLPMLGKQAAAGAATQALVEPLIASARSDLGLETNALADIAGAAIGAAGISGLLRAGAWGIRSAARLSGKEIPFLEPDLPARAENRTSGAPIASAVSSVRDLYARIRGLAPEDLEAAGRLIERDQVMDAAAGARAPEKIDEAAAALEGGKPVTSVEPIAARYAGDTTRQLVRPDGSRLPVKPAIVELGDLIASHDLEGRVNPSYPKELQPRDRAAPASRTWVAEKAAALEPELLGDAPTAGLGAPVIGPDGIVESGNGRVMLIARAYDRHPERAAAYRSFLEAQGYDLEGVKHPVLVRVREGELSLTERARLALEANVSATAGLSTRERALADAKQIDEPLLASWRGGNVSSAENAGFVRAFADRVVAPEERPQFIGADDRLSAEGARRVEAALVAKAWQAEDIVAALYESADPTSKAILGAFADTAPQMARLRAAVAEGRVPAAADPAPALLEAFRLVDRARASSLRVADLVDQVDLERGAVPDAVREAVRLYFRDDALRQAAGRDVVAARIEAATQRALNEQNAIGDLFGVPADARNALRSGMLADGANEVAELPVNAPVLAEDHARYFSGLEQAEVVAVGNLVSSKPAADNVRSSAEAARRMAAAASSEGEKRGPLTVTPLGDGNYLVIDGNATLTAAQKAGWQSLPVTIEPPLFEAGAGIVARDMLDPSFRGRRAALVARQPFASVDEALAKAPAHQEELAAALEGLGIGQVRNPGVKENRARMEQKVAEKYRGDVHGLTDLVRAGVTVETPDAADQIIASLGQRFRVIDEGWRINDVGYMDRKLEVIFADGMMAEVQLWPPAVRAAKHEGEEMYKKRRVAPLAAQVAMMELERAYWAKVQGQLETTWRETIGGSPNASKSSANDLRASASEISRPSQPTSADLTGRQPLAPTEKAASPDTTATVSPQENQRVAGSEAIGTSTKDVSTLGDPVKAQEFERVMAELGDLEVTLEDGSKRSALALIAEARNDATAAAELEACIGEMAEAA